jgi:hypothetical protein
VNRIGPGFDEDYASYGLESARPPFLLAYGRLVELDPSEPENAGATAAAAIDRVANRHIDDEGDSVPFYHPILTPRVRIWPESDIKKERLFAHEFPTADAPDPRVPTLYADESSSSQAWERALLVARPDTQVVRDAPPPKKVSKKKRKLLMKRPFLACRGIVTELTETAFPASYHKPAVTAALLPCARTLAAVDDRPTWEPSLQEAPAQLKHVFAGDAYKEALAIVDPVARAAPVVARILEVLRDDLGFSVRVAASTLSSWTTPSRTRAARR